MNMIFHYVTYLGSAFRGANIASAEHIVLTLSKQKYERRTAPSAKMKNCHLFETLVGRGIQEHESNITLAFLMEY
jgi:hypothetical protein